MLFRSNAMALCLDSSCLGEVIDYYGGLRDLEQKEIRFLHNLSFIDDPTRIIRAIRFAERYKFKIAKISKDAIFTALGTKVLEKISPERFTEELLLIYEEHNYQKMGLSLIDYGVFRSWFQRDYSWNYMGTDDVRGWTIAKRWLVSIKDIEYDDIIEIIERLRFNRHLTKITLDYIRLRKALMINNDNLIRIYGLLSGVSEAILDVLSMQQEFSEVIYDYRKLHKGLHMESTGKKLIELGVKEGPEIGKILKEIKNKWLMGNIKTIAEEKEYLTSYLKRKKEQDK